MEEKLREKLSKDTMGNAMGNSQEKISRMIVEFS